MYLDRPASYFREVLGLPPDHRVDCIVSYGTYDADEQLARLGRTLGALGVHARPVRLGGFLRDVWELPLAGGARCWFTVAYGGATLCEYVHLACLFGAERALHLGSCGGLLPGGRSGDIVVPTWSYGDESITRLYRRDRADHRHPADGTLAAALARRVQPSFSCHTGPVMTTQAMLAQTDDDTRAWSEAGYVGIEMETSTVFAVASRFGVASASLLYVSDNLIAGQAVGDASYVAEGELRARAKDEIYRAAFSELIER